MEIELKSNNRPTEPGLYFYESHYIPGDISCVEVVLVPANDNWGIKFPAYLGIKNWGYNNLERYIGKFSDKITFIK